MRFAILTAVSTPEQASPDKASLGTQETGCRQAALAKGWIETAPPFIVPGESRTRYVNLRDAEEEIPPLRQMLDQARSGAFDVLVLWDYNRLRDLLDPVAKTLAAYNVQLYSVNQPVEPSPEGDSESIMRGMSQIISRSQIADLKRKYRSGMAKRIQRGLYALKIPFGYMKPAGHETDPQAVPVPDPLKTSLLIQLKDAYLSGATQDDLRRLAQASALPAPRFGHWDRSAIADMLRNPFYAGLVSFGRTRLVADPRTQKRRQVENPHPLTAPGQHPPLWDLDTHQRILAEFAARAPAYRTTYNLSGLLTCGICGLPVWARPHEPRQDGSRRLSWCCFATANPRHINMDQPAVNLLAASALQSALLLPLPPPPSTLHPPPSTSLPPPSAIQQITQQRRRIEEAYEAGLYPIEIFAGKVHALDVQLAALVDGEFQSRQTAARRAELTRALTSLQLIQDHLPDWLANEKPARVNHTLRSLCRTITLHPDHAEVEFI